MRPDSDANAALVRADVLVLLREKRYEEALAVLYRARSEAPANAELQKSIDQIKEFLIGAYAKRLGGLDQVARPIPVTAGRSPDIVLLSRYIDGTSTFGDVAQMCPLGKLRTLQVLVGLYPRPESRPGIEPKTALADTPAPARPADQPRLADLPEPEDAPPPETTRRPSAAPAEVIETEGARQYRELFVQGTAAFVQHRYSDAVEAFQACDRLRPGDGAAGVMLRRSLRDLESR